MIERKNVSTVIFHWIWEETTVYYVALSVSIRKLVMPYTVLTYHHTIRSYMIVHTPFDYDPKKNSVWFRIKTKTVSTETKSSDGIYIYIYICVCIVTDLIFAFWCSHGLSYTEYKYLDAFLRNSEIRKFIPKKFYMSGN